ncbi:MAG: hypothetical protein EBS29_06795 [Chloroflexia bacterium]|nr:hypothetical protein [Chloroflexia bacterium]
MPHKKALAIVVVVHKPAGNVFGITAFHNPLVWAINIDTIDGDGVATIIRGAERNIGIAKDHKQIGSAGLTQFAGHVQIGAKISFTYYGSGRNNPTDFRHTATYTMNNNGSLHIEHYVKFGADITDVPRVGVTMAIPLQYRDVTWLGRGPWENYPDRKASAMIGQYNRDVDDLYVPYIMPQENGLRCDVSDVTFDNKRGSSLSVRSDGTFQFSASRFSAAELFKALHTTDLVPRDHIIVNIDHLHRGVGSASCGPDTLDEYKILGRRHRFGFTLAIGGDEE